MSQVIQEIELGPAGIRYVRERLADGKALSKCLLETLDLERGKLTTFLPPGVSEAEVYQFSYGGKLHQAEKRKTTLANGRSFYGAPVPNTDKLLISTIRAHLASTNSPFCIFEHQLAVPEDPWLSHKGLQIATTGRTVLLFLTAGQTDEELIRSTTKRARSAFPPLVGALARSPSEMMLTNGARVEPDGLQRIAEQTEKLIVGAYDGESYLIWTRLL